MSEIKNMAVCDLRHIHSAQTAKEITAIKNVALLLLPKDAPEDVSDALQAIPKSNVATRLVSSAGLESLDIPHCSECEKRFFASKVRQAAAELVFGANAGNESGGGLRQCGYYGANRNRSRACTVAVRGKGIIAFAGQRVKQP